MTSVMVELDVLHSVYRDELAADPPPALAAVHTTVVSAYRLYDSAATDIEYALTYYDAERAEDAVDKIERGGALIEDATAQLEAMLGNYETNF